MMLNRCAARSNPRGWLRLSPMFLMPVRQGGGGPAKRRGKYRGQFEVRLSLRPNLFKCLWKSSIEDLPTFVDKIRIVASGGKGGSGCISLEGETAIKKRPSGGAGGAGGNVYAIADKTLETLDSKLHHYNASGRKGRTGKDAYIRVPCGTLISEVVEEEQACSSFYPWALNDGIKGGGGGERETAHKSEEVWGFDTDESDMKDETDKREEEERGDNEGGDEGQQDCDNSRDHHYQYQYEGRQHDEEEEMRYVADLEQHGEKVLLASGGKPGLGNLNVGSRRIGTKLPGQRGESRLYQFELRTIADVGLVGYPNAGKSTLLGCITAAKPKVAMYPFTTLTPVVGQVEYSDAFRLRVADIPGLIDGAHRNRGLGHEFLRHIARTRALMFVVDVAGSEGRDPVQDFVSLKEELRLYDEELARKPALVVANKTDLPESRGYLEELRRAADPLPVIPISALESRGLLDVVVTMRDILQVGGSDRDSGALGNPAAGTELLDGDVTLVERFRAGG